MKRQRDTGNRSGIATIELVLCVPILLFLAVMLFALGNASLKKSGVAINARHKAWALRDPDKSEGAMQLRDLTEGVIEETDSEQVSVPDAPIADGRPRTALSKNSLLVGVWSDDDQNVTFSEGQAPHLTMAARLAVGAVGLEPSLQDLRGLMDGDWMSASSSGGLSLTDGNFNQDPAAMFEGDEFDVKDWQSLLGGSNPLQNLTQQMAGNAISGVLQQVTGGSSMNVSPQAANQLNQGLKAFSGVLREVGNLLGVVEEAAAAIDKVLGKVFDAADGLLDTVTSVTDLFDDALGAIGLDLPEGTSPGDFAKQISKTLNTIRNLSRVGGGKNHMRFLIDAIRGGDEPGDFPGFQGFDLPESQEEWEGEDSSEDILDKLGFGEGGFGDKLKDLLDSAIPD